MSFSHSGAATLPKGFRYHDANSNYPKTPEPFLEDDNDTISQPPPAPRRPRFRLKRRVASQLSAPTQQFLASVAAADVPIPSIEELQVLPNEPMAATTSTVIRDLDDANNNFLSPMDRPGWTRSLPRTPVPETPVSDSVPTLAPSRYPDWTLDSLSSSDDSGSECESSRPSTARSTQTCASLFSRYSVSSEDLKYLPNTDLTPFPELPSVPADASDESINTDKTQPRRKRRAVWTRPMSEHLWSTYLLYRQDPRVTPFTTGRSCVPPQGVCLRVAREAKRSWRGPNTQATKNKTVGDDKNGGSTPTTPQQSGTFLQWPHTCAATRAHLRELCRLGASSGKQYMANSPTPFSRNAPRFRKRRLTPAPPAPDSLPAPPAPPGTHFAARDMAVSLTISTSESMQPHGPLAQLMRSTPEPMEVPRSLQDGRPLAPDMPSLGHQRLASPFVAQSYGPSSTQGTGAAREVAPQRQHQSHGHRRSLQSPPRLTRSRSNTQKRRSRQSSIEPRRIKRPTMGSDLWTQPVAVTPETERTKQPDRSFNLHSMLFNSTHTTQSDERFVPRTNLAELFATPFSRAQHQSTPRRLSASLALPKEAPPRLASPFSSSNYSRLFPNRSTRAETLCHIGTDPAPRPFATIQQPVEGVSATRTRTLTGRLAYIDERLRELRHRQTSRRRSKSPG
ncbi:hypothetical protein ACRALDRAFT_1062460 [Sodiomyces alcalophilus JCM 7366]|uniref:uncharacterized protein n=1 Tax=Sodiomyces alcalophilus JCM 7366 TaxID=591952 RepID=UPI0039B4F837